MKPVAFDYERPASLREAADLLTNGAEVKVIAGGQSLGPMLNLRLATPRLLVDVTRIAELKRADDEGDAIVLGACVTHAAIEDGRVPDGTRGIMPCVARGIAYRAVRNRGTVGGSLAHADPSADWIVSLAALGAETIAFSARGRRRIPVGVLMIGPFETALAADEIIEAIRIPKVSRNARWGFYKVTRKAGKFADAMTAVLWDADRNVRRVALGAMESRPLVMENADALLERPDSSRSDPFASDGPTSMLLAKAGVADRHALKIHLAALRRAVTQVHTQ